MTSIDSFLKEIIEPYFLEVLQTTTEKCNLNFHKASVFFQKPGFSEMDYVIQASGNPMLLIHINCSVQNRYRFLEQFYTLAQSISNKHKNVKCLFVLIGAGNKEIELFSEIGIESPKTLGQRISFSVSSDSHVYKTFKWFGLEIEEDLTVKDEPRLYHQYQQLDEEDKLNFLLELIENAQKRIVADIKELIKR